MKYLVTLVVLVAVSMVESQYYNFNANNINVDEIISNRRILTMFANCFLGKGSCTKEGRQLKRLFPDALKTECAKCSPAQIIMIRKIDDAFIKSNKGLHQQILAKFDPTGQYRVPFRNYIESH